MSTVSIYLGFSIPAREGDEVITDSYAVSALRTDSTDDDEGSTYLCQCQCCLDPYTPNQPKDLSTFRVSHTYQNNEDLHLIKEIEILLLKAGNGEGLAFSSSIQKMILTWSS